MFLGAPIIRYAVSGEAGCELEMSITEICEVPR
jgi:hypothetical protein